MKLFSPVNLKTAALDYFVNEAFHDVATRPEVGSNKRFT